MSDYSYFMATNQQIDKRKAYIFLLQWLFIALLAGFIAPLLLQGFMFLYNQIIRLIEQSSRIPLIIWPISGVMIVGLLIYRLEPRAKGEGVPSYLRSLRDGSGRLSAKETFFKFWASLLTLGTLGNGGFLSPLGRVSAGILSLFHRWLPRKWMPREHLSLFAVCGMSAAFGALVHSSIGAGIFAVEIIQKANMRYRQLFPAILASTASVAVSQWLGFEPVIRFQTSQETMNIHLVGIILLVTLAAGFTGKGYVILYSKISNLFHRNHVHLSNIQVTLRMLIGSSLAFALCILIHPQLLGTSRELFRNLFIGDFSSLTARYPGEFPLYLLLILLMGGKILANCLTVGSGMSAGFAGPAMLSGLILGAAFADFFGITTGSTHYYSLLAAGFAGVFSSTMNTPIAAGILALELFGMSYSLPAGLAAVVGFQINRHYTLYDMVLTEEA